MRILTVLLAVAGMAFAAGTISGSAGGSGGGFWYPGTDDMTDSYAYNAGEQMSTIGASFGDYAVCDDFPNAVDVDYAISSYITWGVTTASAPTALELLIVADASGVPSSAPISQVSHAVVSTNSGFLYGSYPIWVTTMDLSGSPVAVSSPVWLGPHRAGADSWYPVGGVTVTGSEAYRTLAAGWAWAPFSGSLVAGDLFKIITYTYTSLERTTWAGIKNMF